MDALEYRPTSILFTIAQLQRVATVRMPYSMSSICFSDSWPQKLSSGSMLKTISSLGKTV